LPGQSSLKRANLSLLELSSFLRIALSKLPRMPGNHQILVRRNDPGGYLARGRGDPCGAAGVRRIVQLDAEPGSLLAGAATNFGGVFADTGGEDERVQSAEAGRQ
jgi:hypothetical protein